MFIVEYLLVAFSPCAFIAVDYVLLGRLAEYVCSEELLLMPSQKITVVFLSSDVATFLIQAIGGSLSVSATSAERLLMGSRIILAGLVAQLLSFFTFTFLLLVFLHRIYCGIRTTSNLGIMTGGPWLLHCLLTALEYW